MRLSRALSVLLATGIVLPAWLEVSTVLHAQGQKQPSPIGDATRGEKVALSCSRCHGEGGVSSEAWIPTLAGLRQSVIYKQLEDYRSHRRRPEWYMGSIAQALSLQDS